MRYTLLLTLLASGSTSLFPQAGTLDPSFSGDGKLTIDLAAWYDQINAVAVQPDGKIVGAGWVGDGNFADIVVQRLLPDGTPDPGFGLGGVVYSPSVDDLHYAYGVGVQSTGHIVVAGLAYDLSFDGNVVLLRFLSDGTPDPGFGTNGLISTDLGGGPGFQGAYGLRVMDDDRIVIVGQEDENGITCARFSANGIPDATYGTGGVAVSGVPASTGICMHLMDDGSVIAGGYALPGGYPDWMLARFDPDGILDLNFGTGGIMTIDIGSSSVESMKGVSVLSDGRIAACGYQGFNGQDDEPVVAMFNSDGTPDAGFATGGILVLPFTAPQWGQATSLVVGPDDKLLVAGFRVEPGTTSNNDFFLFRLLDDGSYDPDFASGTQVFTDLSGSYDRAQAMALAPDGAIVVAGYGTVTETATAYAKYANDISMAVNKPDAEAVGLTIFPMPASDHVCLDLNNEPRGPVTISLFANDGHLVLMRTAMPQTAPLRLDLPVHLANGSYMVEVRTATKVRRQPLMLLHSDR